jgi:hypothetical protein
MRGDASIATMHAHGAQIYECKADPAGMLSWQLREPIASLMIGGRTMGRHYAGPTWEMLDGTKVTAKVDARAPGATTGDVPLLWLVVTSRSGKGSLAEAAFVRRINTHGGVLSGACDSVGTLRAVPYSADYTFHSKKD